MRASAALFTAAPAASLAGCVRAQKVESHAEWLAEATRAYGGETQERVIAAAERVLRHADPGDVAFDYGLGGFTADRKFLVYAVLAAAEGEDRWTFRAAETRDGVRASVGLVERARVHGAGPARTVRAKSQVVGTYRLFYARLDYVLGRRADWVSCQAAPQALGLDAGSPGTGPLCGLTVQGRDAPPPPRLGAPPRTVKVAARPEPAAEPPDEGED